MRVAILLPHMGEVSTEFADRTYGPLKFVPIAEFEKITFSCRGLPVHVARNMLVETALGDEKVTHLFWVDSDIVFEQPQNPNEAILRLLMCDAPIASGIYRARQKAGFNWAMWTRSPNGDGFIPIQDWTGNWIQVDAIGFGCVLIRREVFEKLPKPYFTWTDPEPSEDFLWCEAAKKHGFEINVYTDVRCSHISGQLKVLADGSVTTLDV